MGWQKRRVLHHCKLETAFKELYDPCFVISLKNAITVDEFHPYNFRHVPVNHRCNTRHFSTFNGTVIQVQRGHMKDTFQFAEATFEYGFFNRDKSENAG